MATRESIVREAAERAIRKASTVTARQAINEAARVQKSEYSRKYDYFLSHAHRDANIVLGVKKLIEDRGYSVYVDWIDDPNNPGDAVTEANAEKIRSAMSRCEKMVYLHTEASSISKWCPWELGYFDNKGSDLIRVVYVSSNSLHTPGQEYLKLYRMWDLN